MKYVGILLCFMVTALSAAPLVSLENTRIVQDDWGVSYEWGRLPIDSSGVYRVESDVKVVYADLDNLALLIPPSPYPMEVFINDALVYVYGDLEDTQCLANFSPAFVRLGPELITPDQTNQFTVYFYTDGERVALPEFRIGSQERIERRYLLQKLLNSTFIQLLSLNSLILFSVFIMLSFYTKYKTKIYRYYALLSLFIGLAYIPFVFNYSTAPEIFLTKVSKSSFVLAAYFIFLFCIHLYRIQVWIFLKRLLAFFSFAGVVLIFAQQTKYAVNDTFAFFMVMQILPLFLFATSLILWRNMFVRGVENILLATGTLLLLATSFYDMYFILVEKEPFFWSTAYGYMGLSVACVCVLMIHHKRDIASIELQKLEIDQTSRKLLHSNQMLVESTRKIEEYAHLKNRFIKSITHEIVTPINGIADSTDYLRSLDFERDTAEPYIDNLLISYYNLTILFNNLVDYTSLDESDITLECHKYNFEKSIQRLVEYTRKNAQSKGLTFSFEYTSGGLPSLVYGDEKRIAQVILNLLNNAIKFTEFGSVTLKISCEEHTLFCSVSDTGVGIDPTLKENIFKAFTSERSYSTGKEMYANIGLGLAITHRIVTSMGGNISFRSRKNRGSTFSIEVPLQRISDSPSTDSSIEQKRILVAEDNPINQKLITILLKTYNLVAVVVGNGFEAVERVKQESFDLVIMDIQMPVMDGLEATREIKKLCPSLPVIAWTANSTSVECSAAGVDGFLSKPTSRESLYHEVLDRIT
ncbi:ATP-binding protein [Chitinivibrio alkaliphilus]|uniref:histidine kinase n=1 Tax=Chitinivibrio alkaliphilus ACht1 TaxID=1313304 RepID=U7D8W7_9BACT|nr:ATP-binding protein [Chitinivibrio alkaliphilus]ERP38829.1 histidine kinase [Chitinivibrio alkaliphilus ACht1]